MKPFVVHDVTGKILRSGTCQDETFELQAGTGETVIDGQADDSLNYVEAGEIKDFPACPDPHHRWDWETLSWVCGEFEINSAIESAKENKKSEINAAYLSAIQQPVSYTSAGGAIKSYQADAGSQDVLLKAITGYELQGSVPAGFFWRSADNENVPFSLVDLRGLYAAMLAQGWAAFQSRTEKIDAINAAETIASIETIVW